MIFQETLLIALLILVWLSGVYIHNMGNQPTQDLIKLPRAICLLLGSYKANGYVNFKALFAQITILLLTVVISLVNFSQITRQQAYDFLTWSIGVLAILITVISIYKERRSK